jgi:SAM-dependent methyltransferase
MTGALASLKSIVKPLVPGRLVQFWQRRRYEAEQAHYKDRPLGDVFEEIYERHTWDQQGNGRYRSGPGSSAGVTQHYEAFVVGYIARHPHIRTLVDIGCGDFQVSRRILDALAAQGREVAYVGCDIAANVVTYNNEVFGRPGVQFRSLDVTRELPPEGDIVTVREVFQHLSNAHIASALDNLARRFECAIITESLVEKMRTPNVDIVSGYRTRDGYQSGVMVDLAPFNRTVIEEHVTVPSPAQRWRTTVVALCAA